SSRDRIEWHPYRLWRRARDEVVADQPRAPLGAGGCALLGFWALDVGLWHSRAQSPTSHPPPSSPFYSPSSFKSRSRNTRSFRNACPRWLTDDLRSPASANVQPNGG